MHERRMVFRLASRRSSTSKQLDTSGEARLRYHRATEAATAGIKLRDVSGRSAGV